MAAVKRSIRAVAIAERQAAAELEAVQRFERWQAYRAEVSDRAAAAGVSMAAPGVEFVPVRLLYDAGVTAAAAAGEVVGMAADWAALEAAGI